MAKYETKEIVVEKKVAPLVAASTATGVVFNGTYNPPLPNNTVDWTLTGYMGVFPFFTMELDNIDTDASVENTTGALLFGGAGLLGGITNPTSFNGFPVLGIVQGDGSSEDLRGGTFSDDIYGRGGNDYIYGWEGNDYLDGGNGADFIYGGDGDDCIDGGNGADNLFGEDGDDNILGGNGGDKIYGGDGDDCIDGGAGNDEIYGGKHNDYIAGGDGNDKIYGEQGNDILLGQAGRDFIYGGGGDDIIDGGKVGAGEEDDDVMTGQGGKDCFVFAADADTTDPDTAYTGDDRINGFQVAGASKDQIDGTCLVDMEFLNVDIINNNRVIFEFWDQQGSDPNDGNDRLIGTVDIRGAGVGARAANSTNYGFDGDELFLFEEGTVVFNLAAASSFEI